MKKNDNKGIWTNNDSLLSHWKIINKKKQLETHRNNVEHHEWNKSASGDLESKVKKDRKEECEAARLDNSHCARGAAHTNTINSQAKVLYTTVL